jgi:hypothetical protein
MSNNKKKGNAVPKLVGHLPQQALESASLEIRQPATVASANGRGFRRPAARLPNPVALNPVNIVGPALRARAVVAAQQPVQPSNTARVPYWVAQENALATQCFGANCGQCTGPNCGPGVSTNQCLGATGACLQGTAEVLGPCVGAFCKGGKRLIKKKSRKLRRKTLRKKSRRS